MLMLSGWESCLFLDDAPQVVRLLIEIALAKIVPPVLTLLLINIFFDPVWDNFNVRIGQIRTSKCASLSSDSLAASVRCYQEKELRDAFLCWCKWTKRVLLGEHLLEVKSPPPKNNQNNVICIRLLILPQPNTSISKPSNALQKSLLSSPCMLLRRIRNFLLLTHFSRSYDATSRFVNSDPLSVFNTPIRWDQFSPHLFKTIF